MKQLDFWPEKNKKTVKRERMKKRFNEPLVGNEIVWYWDDQGGFECFRCGATAWPQCTCS